MNSSFFEKYKFRLRSLPNSKTFPKYFGNYCYFFLVLVVYNLIDICLLSERLMPTIPPVFVIAIPVVFVHTYLGLEYHYKNVGRETLKEVVVHIRLKQTQSLIEKLDDNPEILNGTFNNKSLLYWARRYNNVEANTILIEYLKSHSKKA